MAVQDLIICGKLESGTASRIVAACAAACAAQGCVLTGGETTEQPDVVPAGTYILGSSIVGIVERRKVIDGSGIKAGHIVLSLAASGPHTNGFTLIRDLLERTPSLAEKAVGDSTFLEAVLEPHRCYYRALEDAFDSISGMAHITGGGIRENLNRILPKDLDARIDLAAYRPNRAFRVIRDAGGLTDAEMLRTFNLGVGLALVCAPRDQDRLIEHLKSRGQDSYVIGEIVPGNGVVECHGSVPYGD